MIQLVSAIYITDLSSSNLTVLTAFSRFHLIYIGIATNPVLDFFPSNTHWTSPVSVNTTTHFTHCESQVNGERHVLQPNGKSERLERKDPPNFPSHLLPVPFSPLILSLHYPYNACSSGFSREKAILRKRVACTLIHKQENERRDQT